MKCNYSPQKYWLCEHSERRANDIWLNSGHPCRYSIGAWIGEIECGYEESKKQEQGKPDRNKDIAIEHA